MAKKTETNEFDKFITKAENMADDFFTHYKKDRTENIKHGNAANTAFTNAIKVMKMKIQAEKQQNQD